MILETLNRIDAEFGLGKLCKQGIIRMNDLRDREMYYRYDALRKVGHKKMEALYMTSDEFRLALNTVRRAVDRMQG